MSLSSGSVERILEGRSRSRSATPTRRVEEAEDIIVDSEGERRVPTQARGTGEQRHAGAGRPVEQPVGEEVEGDKNLELEETQTSLTNENFANDNGAARHPLMRTGIPPLGRR